MEKEYLIDGFKCKIVDKADKLLHISYDRTEDETLGQRENATSADARNSLIIPETLTIDGVAHTVAGITCICDNAIETIVIPKTVRDVSGYQPASEQNMLCSDIEQDRMQWSFTHGLERPLQCPALQRIVVDDDNKWLTSQHGVLYDKAMTTLIVYPEDSDAQSFTVPRGITAIRPYAFFNTRKLMHVSLPDTLKSIGDYAFAGDLLGIVIPHSVETIGREAFAGCYALLSALTCTDSAMTAMKNHVVAKRTRVYPYKDYMKRFVVPGDDAADGCFSFRYGGIYRNVSDIISMPCLTESCDNLWDTSAGELNCNKRMRQYRYRNETAYFLFSDHNTGREYRIVCPKVHFNKRTGLIDALECSIYCKGHKHEVIKCVREMLVTLGFTPAENSDNDKGSFTYANNNEKKTVFILPECNWVWIVTMHTESTDMMWMRLLANCGTIFDILDCDGLETDYALSRRSVIECSGFSTIL